MKRIIFSSLFIAGLLFSVNGFSQRYYDHGGYGYARARVVIRPILPRIVVSPGYAADCAPVYNEGYAPAPVYNNGYAPAPACYDNGYGYRNERTYVEQPVVYRNYHREYVDRGYRGERYADRRNDRRW